MIKRMLVVLAVAAPMLAQAEVQAGTIEIMGSSQLGFSNTTFKPDGGSKSERSNFGANVGGLFYVTPMLGLGAEVFYDKTTDSFQGVDTKFSQLGFGPKVGLDFPIGPQASLFGEALIGISASDNDGFKTSGVTFGLGAGVKFFPAKAVSLNFGINYQSTSLKDQDSSAKATSTNLFVGVGVSGYIGAK
jgi:opacity protein-like surface antigen